MDIEVSQAQGRVPVTVFHLRGSLDTTSFAQLEQQAREAFEAGMRHLLIDLSEVTFISSAGVRSLTSVFRMLRSAESGSQETDLLQGVRDGTYKSATLKLAGARPEVQNVLKITGADMFLDLHANREEALAAF